jgi:protein-disulfide isomerase
MAKERVDGGRGRRPGVVNSAKRGGPGRGFWLALGVVAVVGIGALGYVASRPRVTTRTIDPNLPALKAEGYLIGSPSAPLEITEFADFECPGCGQFATLTEPDVRAKLVNTGKIRMRFMDFPLPMHKNTWDASLAAACANDQGKFWEMHDRLFANQAKLSAPELKEHAVAVGLTADTFNQCLDSGKYTAEWKKDSEEAGKLGLSGTPAFFINGRLLSGAQVIDEELALAESKKPAAGS